MLRIFMTLLIFSPLWANANPALILNLLYETDDLAFLHSKASDGNSKTTPIIAEDQARSLAADLSQSILRDDAIEPIYRAMRLTNVGILQTYAGDLATGDQSLRAALALFNQSKSAFDPQLTGLLSALGINGFLREDYDTAEDYFRRSQNIQHRSLGLFTAEQTSNLNWLTRVYLITDEPAAADNTQRYILKIAKRVFPAGGAALSEVKVAIAAYLGQRARTLSPFADDLNRLLRQTLFNESLELLAEAISEISEAEGRYAAALIEPLETKARIHSWRGGDRRLQEQALEQILAIIQNQTDTTPAELSEAWLALADGYILTENKKALTAYRKAWVAKNPESSADPAGGPVANLETLEAQTLRDLKGTVLAPSEPVLLWPTRYQPIYFDPRSDKDDATPNPSYAVDLRFTISTEGRPKRIKVINKNVPNREVRWTRDMVRSSRYRPALRNGIAEEVVFTARQVFIPRPSKNTRTRTDAPSPLSVDTVDTVDTDTG